MARYRRHLAIVLIASAITAAPILLGFSSGALDGFSGGAANFAANCTTCHPFNLGTGTVEVMGAPQRYRPNETYNLTVRVTDPVQFGAGFEISAEGVGGHVGTLFVSDPVNTRFASSSLRYITHTSQGLANSRADWAANGGSFDFPLQWQAPGTDAGPVTFFAAANSVENIPNFAGVRYYADHVISHYAVTGDGDGDTDVDLDDYAMMIGCMGALQMAQSGPCLASDANGDGQVNLADVAVLQTAFTGATATVPAGYVQADSVRGGLLYDRWWVVNGAPVPTGNHPLYPVIGQQSGSATYRCKECHGWDYKGLGGAYGLGSTHYTGIVGVEGTTLTPQQLFDLLKADPLVVPGGHDMDAFGMSDRDLWDVVKMTLEGVIDTDVFISPTCVGGSNNGSVCILDSDCVGGTCTGPSVFMGDSFNGQDVFNNLCAYCHGPNGTDLDFGGGEVVGTVANQNPWEFLHKLRFGQPGAPMTSFRLVGWNPQLAADTGVYAATLPQQPLPRPAATLRLVKSKKTTARYIRGK